MRIEMKRPLGPENAAPEIARLIARALQSDDELAAAPGVNVTVEEPIERDSLRAQLQDDRFFKKLTWQLQEILRRTPRAIHLKYEAGLSRALVIEPCSGRGRAARLEWESGAFEIDGTKLLLAVGRGSIRKRFPGARNDVVLDGALTFVSRDAFVLRWDPARSAWRVEVDELGRAFVSIERHGSVLIPQLGSIPLESGDLIVLTEGLAGSDRLAIRFTEGSGS
jgi:hypothetical protein